MIIGDRSFASHLRLLAPLFFFVASIWLLRLILHCTGVPQHWTQLASVTIAITASILLAVVKVYLQEFGGYVNVVFSTFLLVSWGHLLIVAAILFSVVTGVETVYSIPEFSMSEDDPHHLRHIYGHLTFGIGLGTLFGSAVGCLLLWLLRTLVPGDQRSV